MRKPDYISLADLDAAAKEAAQDPLVMPKDGPPKEAFKAYADRLNEDAAQLVADMKKAAAIRKRSNSSK